MERANPPYDAIVCLGKNWQKKWQSRFTHIFYPSVETARTAIACGELIKDGEAAKLIFPTGHTIKQGPGENEAGVAQLRSIFSEEEIPNTAIVIATTPDSIDTAGDAQATRNVAEKEGWSKLKLVTIKRHLPRAEALFENHGVPVVATEATEDILIARGYNLDKSTGEKVRERIDTSVETILYKLLKYDPDGSRPRKFTQLIRR